MRLFEIDDASQTVMLNKTWIMLIPAFAELIRRDKGSPGDTQARRKLRATKEFTYIYFYKDFSSPLYDYDEEQRHIEALRYAALEDKDIKDEKVQDALNEYETLMRNASRALRTLRSVEKAMDKLDQYYGTLNFEKTLDDKQPDDPDEFLNRMSKLNKMYDEYEKFEKRVKADLRVGLTIRGKGELGDGESKTREWDESVIRESSPTSATTVTGKISPSKETSSMMDLLKVIPME